ncbi:tetratricopeptide repeat protein [Candidatus Poribacteria bacterium]|nr:tetratricopeptide repeat protein [Candidatus Poribacteria bacterium]
MNPRTTLATIPPGFAALLSLIVLLTVVASVPWVLKRSRETAFGMLWFLVVFAPMSNIIPIFPDVAGRELFTPIHFLYLPSIGIFLCAGIGLRTLDRRRKATGKKRRGNDIEVYSAVHIEQRFFRASAMGCITCVVAIFCVLSIRRNTIWENDTRLFEYMTRMHPENAGARVNLGNAYLGAGREFDALKEFKEAVRLDPNLAQAHNALGLAYLNMGSASEAIVELRKNTELDPSNSGAFSNLAVAYVQKGMLPEAIAAGMNAIERAPTSSETHTNMGLIYMEARKLDEAQKELELALDFNRGDAEAYNALGALHFYRKDYAKARWNWEQALRIRPDLQEARENLESLEKKAGERD